MLLVDLLDESEASLRPAFDSAALEGLPIVITSFRGLTASVAGGSDKAALLDGKEARGQPKRTLEGKHMQRPEPVLSTAARGLTDC